MKKTLFIYKLSENQKKIVKEKIFSSPAFRKEYFKYDFYSFVVWMFREEFYFKFADFQKEYIESLANGENIFFVGFRGSAKSTLLIYYYIWCIVYEKRHYIMHYNSDLSKSKQVLRTIATELIENTRIIELYGKLFSLDTQKKDNKKQKTIGDFITENGIKLEAMSIGKSPRGKSFKYKGVTYRPDLVGFDDIDTDKNLSKDLIKKDIEFILGEAFGGMEAYAQKIFLGNVIKEYGRVPILKEHFEKNKTFKIFWVKIRNYGKIVWERYVATNAQAEKINKNIDNPKHHVISLEFLRQDQGEIAFNQNYNLIPYTDGTIIIPRSKIKFYDKLPNTKNIKFVMGIDPAFSQKDNTDPIGITITAQEKFEGKIYKYVVENVKLEGKQKDYLNFINTVKFLYQNYNINVIYIENNNGGETLGRMLKDEKLSVIIFPAKKDKITRLMEYEAEFERGIIKFNKEKTGDLIEELVNFPNGEHDDQVDSMVHSFKPFISKVKLLGS